MRVTLSETPPGPFEAVLLEGFRAFNAPFVQGHASLPLRLEVFRDGEEAACGGLLGYAYAGWLHVRMFWLPEELRRDGLGARLLCEAEAWARGHGCLGAYLDTFTFQARPFYEKQGYRLFGVLPDCPPGHARQFMMKRFDGDTHVSA
jgi:GNAT superfamily N-acetyltransferase